MRRSNKPIRIAHYNKNHIEIDPIFSQLILRCAFAIIFVIHKKHDVSIRMQIVEMIRSFRLETVLGRCANRRIKIMTPNTVSKFVSSEMCCCAYGKQKKHWKKKTIRFDSRNVCVIFVWMLFFFLVDNVELNANLMWNTATNMDVEQVCDGAEKKGVYMDEALTRTSECQ